MSSPMPSSLFRIAGLGMSGLVAASSYRLTRSRARREVTMLPCQEEWDFPPCQAESLHQTSDFRPTCPHVGLLLVQFGTSFLHNKDNLPGPR